jgi:hypothetical protein
MTMITMFHFLPPTEDVRAFNRAGSRKSAHPSKTKKSGLTFKGFEGQPLSSNRQASLSPELTFKLNAQGERARRSLLQASLAQILKFARARKPQALF